MTFDDCLAIARFLDALRERVWEMQTAPWCRGLRGFALNLWNGIDVTVDPGLPTVQFLIYADSVASSSPGVAEGVTDVMALVNTDLNRPLNDVPTEAFVALIQELVDIGAARTGSEPLVGRAVGPVVGVNFSVLESDGPTVSFFISDDKEDLSNPYGMVVKSRESNILCALMAAVIQARRFKGKR